MERFLAWVVTAMFSWFFRLVAVPIFTLAFRIGDKVYFHSEALFWVIVFLEGSTILGLLVTGIVFGCNFVVKASQKMCRSVKGTRYTVIGIVCIANYALLLFGAAEEVAKVPTAHICAYIACIFYNIALIVIGRTQAKEDREAIPEEEKTKASSPVQASGGTYSVKNEFVDFLLSDNPMLTRAEAENFYHVIMVDRARGKEAAIASFSDMVHKIAEGDLLRATFVVSYLCGALAACEVLTKEESDSLSEKYRNALLDLLEQERKEEQTQA